tara:strand:+ start:759 stop:3887 length:3129 start_codon:yes stop_codon:yes gene_type:complete
MKQNFKPIQIINASAGSGKTYTLVFYFLKTLLSATSPEMYRKMIALTFTNKAVFEMKSRILNTLKDFSFLKEEEDVPQMSIDLCKALELSREELVFRSKQTLKFILHDYEAFEVVTLDRFTHRVIRSFAHDLGLSLSFEVEIQQEQMLTQVVERVIEKVGQNEEITRLLKQFTLQKMDDQLSWDISQNLINIAKLLLSENDRIPLHNFLLKDRAVFDDTHKFLMSYRKICKEKISLLGKQTIEFILSNDLTHGDFSRGTVFKHFLKLQNLNFIRLYENKLEENFQLEKNIYKKTLDSEKINRIDSILDDLRTSFHKGKKLYYQFSLANDIIKQWIPLSLIKIINEELEVYQQESNKVLLGSFNSRISKEILHQPTPYIYERLGQNYRHYFLDEFQDTSFLQWANLIPLIKEPLEGLDANGSEGSLLIVGDPKQAIYRWRGGHVDQFLRLLDKQTPFQQETNISSLQTNYRSFDTIINFNNEFFKSILPQINDTKNRSIFSENCQQKTNAVSGGYVEIDQFYEKGNKSDITKIHIQKTYDAIVSALDQNFTHNEISILVRTKDQANAISEFLASREMPFLSSESLNLSHSKQVQFLIALLRLVLDENQLEHRLVILEFLKNIYGKDEDYHDFVSTYLRIPPQDFFDVFQIHFNFSKFKSSPIYEAVESAFYSFEMSGIFDAHLQSFLDHVFEFSQQKQNDFLSFILNWDQQGASLYVATPRGIDAVQILTVHKSKGLEFPVVIVPFLDAPIQSNHKTQVWLDTKEMFGETLEESWISFSKKIENYGAAGIKLVEQTQSANELDALNVLYVALTRPVEQLILISNGAISKEDSYPEMIQNYLKQKNAKESEIFSLGQKRQTSENIKINEKSKIFLIEQKANPWQKQIKTLAFNPKDFETNQTRVWGILIHELLSKIEIAEDVDWIIEDAFKLGKIELKDKKIFKKILKNIVEHPKLKSFYTNDSKVWNERDILVPNGKNIRPDRLVKRSQELVLIDYKTGVQKEADHEQLIQYKNIIGQVFIDKKIKCYLVYIKKNAALEVEMI